MILKSIHVFLIALLLYSIFEYSKANQFQRMGTGFISIGIILIDLILVYIIFYMILKNLGLTSTKLFSGSLILLFSFCGLLSLTYIAVYAIKPNISLASAIMTAPLAAIPFIPVDAFKRFMETLRIL